MKPPPLDDPDFAPAAADAAEMMAGVIRDELAEGERLVWLGQPRPGDGDEDAPVAGVGVLGVLVGSCVAALGLLRGLPGAAALGVVLIIGGVAALGAGLRLLAGCWPRAAYALTDRRVILREPVPFGSVRVRSLGPADLAGISRIEHPDGSGDIVLEGTGSCADGTPGPIPLARLRRLDGARAVEALIRATLFGD